MTRRGTVFADGRAAPAGPLSRQQRRDLASAERLFAQAIRVAGDGTEGAAASHFERARRVARRAFRELGTPYGRSLLPFAAPGLDARCDATLVALRDAYWALGDATAKQRMDDAGHLRKTLAEPMTSAYGGWSRHQQRDAIETLERLVSGHKRTSHGAGPAPVLPQWELTQIQIVLARLHAAPPAPRWNEVDRILREVISRLEQDEDGVCVSGLDLRARRSCALRNSGQPHMALDLAAECVRRHPLSIDGRREAGRAHFVLREYEEALDAWRHALYLNPSDAYLHFEIALCLRRMAEQRRGRERERRLEQAHAELSQALALFDGEDFDGAAWTRMWRGRVALERGRTEDAIEDLEAATHDAAAIAAWLFLGEARLRASRYELAKHAFERACELKRGQAREGFQPGLASWGEVPIDAKWGDELPPAAFEVRLARGLTEAQHLTPGELQLDTRMEVALTPLEEAYQWACEVPDERARTQCLALCLESKARILRASHRLNEALEATQERLRLEPTAEAFLQEAELLELLLARDGHGSEPSAAPASRPFRRLAAERAWYEGNNRSVPDGNGRATHPVRERRELIRRAVKVSRS